LLGLEVHAMSILGRLQELLDESGVEYEVLHHREDFRARTTAADTHTPAGEFAKTVVMWVDGAYALAVLPATHFVAEGRFERSVGAEKARLATEFEMRDLLPDCEVGAAPPIGGLFGLPTYVSPVLARREHITFNAGTHSDAVRLTWSAYHGLAEPKVVAMSRHEED
jgi:Ala-tRNA(Pro) deacylase